MISGKFIKSSLLYTIGGAMPMASGLVLLPFYTNMLSLELYGTLMLYVVFSLFMQSLTSYALDAYINVHYVEVKDDKAAAGKMIGAVAGLLLVIGAGTSLLAWFTGEPVFDLTFNRSGTLDFAPWGFMSVVTGFFNGFFKAGTNLLIFRQEPWRFLGFNFFNFLLTIGISLAGLYMFPGELTGPMYGRLLSGAGIFLLTLFFIWRNYGINFSFGHLKDLNRFCLPYMFYLILVWLVTNLDRYIINDALDAGTVGLYDFAVRCTLLVSLVQDGMVAAINPLVYSLWRDSGRNESLPETNRYFNVYAAVGIIFIAGFSLIIPLCIPWVVKNQDYYATFVFMGALASGFATRGLYHYLLLKILYLKKTQLLSVAFGLSAVVQIPMTLYFANEWGLSGVVWANIAAKAVQSLFLYVAVRRHFVIRLNPWKMIVLPVFYIGASIALWYVLREYRWEWYALLFVVTSAFIFIIYRKEILITGGKLLKRRLP